MKDEKGKVKSEVHFAQGLFDRIDGIDGIDEERIASEFRELKEFKEFSEALSTFICKAQQLIFSLNSLYSLNSPLSHRAKRYPSSVSAPLYPSPCSPQSAHEFVVRRG